MRYLKWLQRQRSNVTQQYKKPRWIKYASNNDEEEMTKKEKLPFCNELPSQKRESDREVNQHTFNLSSLSAIGFCFSSCKTKNYALRKLNGWTSKGSNNWRRVLVHTTPRVSLMLLFALVLRLDICALRCLTSKYLPKLEQISVVCTRATRCYQKTRGCDLSIKALVWMTQFQLFGFDCICQSSICLTSIGSAFASGWIIHLRTAQFQLSYLIAFYKIKKVENSSLKKNLS